MANLTQKDRTRARNRESNGHTDGRLPAWQQPELVPYAPFTCFPQSQPEGPAPQMHTVRAEHHGTEALPHTYTRTHTPPPPSRPWPVLPTTLTHLPGDPQSQRHQGTGAQFTHEEHGMWPSRRMERVSLRRKSSTSHTRASNVEMSSFPWEGNYKNALKMFTIG